MSTTRQYKRWLRDLKKNVREDFERFIDVFVDSDTGEAKIPVDSIHGFGQYVLKSDSAFLGEFSKKLDEFLDDHKKQVRKIEQLMVKYESQLTLVTKLEMSFAMAERKEKIEIIAGIGSSFLICCGL